MRNKINEILKEYSLDSVASMGIPLYHFEGVATKIVEIYQDIEKENMQLKNQIEMKNALIETYETIIGNSNFKPILNKTKKSKEK